MNFIILLMMETVPCRIDLQNDLFFLSSSLLFFMIAIRSNLWWSSSGNEMEN